MRRLLRRLPAACVIAIAFVSVGAGAARAQAPGYAEILQPTPGSALQGVVTIRGSANHPAMTGYDLAFAIAGDPTGTWFPILEGSTTPVVRDRLALWDTTGLTDGVYDLRLQVQLEDGTVLEALAAGLRLRNYTPVETPTLAPVPLGPTSVPSATPTLPLPAGPTPSPAARPASDVVVLAWLAGGLAALMVLALLAGYAQARARRAQPRPTPSAPPARRRRSRPGEPP